MADDYYTRNKAWIKPGAQGFNTPLGVREPQFRKWVKDNKIPFDPDEKNSDYDMRGFWKALQSGDPKAQSAIDSNDKQLHYPDYWKTPYHQTFSNESQWATPDAPSWNDQDQLVDKSGNVLFDDKAQHFDEGGAVQGNDGWTTIK